MREQPCRAAGFSRISLRSIRATALSEALTLLLSSPQKRGPSIPEADIAKSQRQSKGQRLLGPRFRGDDSGEVGGGILFTIKKYAKSENNA